MRFGLAGGGTGGHAYPSLAVSERLRARGTHEFIYYGTEHGPERALAESEGMTYHPVKASQVRGRSPIRLVRGTINLARGLRDASRWLEQDQPDALFATGGYAAAPVGRAAKRKDVPVLLFVPDVRPGWAVRYLQRHVTAVACSVHDTLAHLPRLDTVVTGYPVRQQFIEATREGGQTRFGLDPQLQTVLVTGGSHGAHHINTAISRSARTLLERLQLIHICGRNEEDWLRRERDRLPDWQRERYHLHAYTEDMAWAMAAADLAVTRAGASVLGELPVSELPAIVIPLGLADQRLNAGYLAERGAAIALEGSEVDELDRVILRLLDDDAGREAMAASMRELARPQAADRLAEMLEELAA